MIETFMAEATCIRGPALWSLLASLVGCAAEVEVLSSGRPDGSVLLESGPAQNDAADFEAGPASDAGAAQDGGWVETSTLPENGTEPPWTVCNPSAPVLALGRSGDRCTFVGGCARAVGDCGRRTAWCGQDGALRMGEVTKAACVADDPADAGRCTRPAGNDPCCFEIWPCNAAATVPDPAQVARVCALDCQEDTRATDGAAVTGCPDVPNAPPWPRVWPPPAGTPCQGNFVCDSHAFSAAPAAIFELDRYGRMYGCLNGAVQGIAIGSTIPPWNSAAAPAQP